MAEIMESVRNSMLDRTFEESAYVTLHSDVAESNNQVGSKHACLLNPATGGFKEMAAPVVFEIPPKSVVSHWAVWSGSEMVIRGELSNPETYENGGRHTLNSLRIGVR